MPIVVKQPGRRALVAASETLARMAAGAGWTIWPNPVPILHVEDVPSGLAPLRKLPTWGWRYVGLAGTRMVLIDVTRFDGNFVFSSSHGGQTATDFVRALGRAAAAVRGSGKPAHLSVLQFALPGHDTLWLRNGPGSDWCWQLQPGLSRRRRLAAVLPPIAAAFSAARAD